MTKHFKAINYRFYDKDQMKKFMSKIQYDENSSFQEFVSKAIEDYLKDKYNPYTP